MINLKPCPFCGGVAELKAPGYEHYSPCWCKCTRCGAEGPTKSSELEAEKGWNERVQDNVEPAPTIGGWISVKERLPEKDKDVIIYGYYVGPSGAIYPTTIVSDIEEFKHCECVPVAWMPIPEPPQEVENETRN